MGKTPMTYEEFLSIKNSEAKNIASNLCSIGFPIDKLPEILVEIKRLQKEVRRLTVEIESLRKTTRKE